MNVNQQFFPRPHPEWGCCFEELFFYTSRYAGLSVVRLAKLCGQPVPTVNGYRASQLTNSQRYRLAEWFALPPSTESAAGILNIISLPTKRRQRGSPPFLGLLHDRPRQSSGIARVHPLSQFKHLANRYHFDVSVSGNHVVIDCQRLDRLLQHGSARVQQNLLEALQCLNRAGYQVVTRRECTKVAIPVMHRQQDLTRVLAQ